MVIRTLCISGVVVCLVSTAAVAGAYGENASNQNIQMIHRHAGKSRLPRELKIVWRQEEHVRLKAMPKDQRHGWLKRQWAAMSIRQKEDKIAELRAKWNRLPPDVRQAMLQRKEQRREARRMQRAEMSATTRQSPAQSRP